MRGKRMRGDPTRPTPPVHPPSRGPNRPLSEPAARTARCGPHPGDPTRSRGRRGPHAAGGPGGAGRPPLPAASALRAAYPGSQLAWLVERPSADLVRALPWVDEVIEFPRAELRRGLRGAGPGRAARTPGGLARSVLGAALL